MTFLSSLVYINVLFLLVVVAVVLYLNYSWIFSCIHLFCTRSMTPFIYKFLWFLFFCILLCLCDRDLKKNHKINIHENSATLLGQMKQIYTKKRRGQRKYKEKITKKTGDRHVRL